jgi:hypothetical protein
MAENEQLRLNYESSVWYLDSAATHYMTPNKEIINNFEEIKLFPIYASDGKQMQAIGKGEVTLDTTFRGEILLGTIKEVYYVPGLVANLFSSGKLNSNGFTINLILKDAPFLIILEILLLLEPTGMD